MLDRVDSFHSRATNQALLSRCRILPRSPRVVLVLLTLFGALPMYPRVAAKVAHGDGSNLNVGEPTFSLEGKVVCSLCYSVLPQPVSLSTITLSAATPHAHIVENPFCSRTPQLPPSPHHRKRWVLIAALAAIFLKGFKEAIGIAVLLVAVYLLMNMRFFQSVFMKSLLIPRLS